MNERLGQLIPTFFVADSLVDEERKKQKDDECYFYAQVVIKKIYKESATNKATRR